jgi:hypothetical protein
MLIIPFEILRKYCGRKILFSGGVAAKYLCSCEESEDKKRRDCAEIHCPFLSDLRKEMEH